MSLQNFDYYAKQVGYVKPLNPPEVKSTWVAYKLGEVKHFDSKAQALKHSPNVEQIKDVHDLAAVKEYWEHARGLEAKAIQLWDAALREKYSFLTERQYTICYSEAYDNGHHAGYDEVASCMSELVDFAIKFKEAV